MPLIARAAPAASRCPRCDYLPASATVICPRCGHDRRNFNPSFSKDIRMSTSSRISAAPLAAFLAVLFVAGCAGLEPAVAVTESLKASADESLAMIVPARGVQIYECRESKDKPGEYGWAFVAPEADLYDRSGSRKIGKHFAGPQWESADGSRVQGTTKEHVDAPEAGSIAWLLLSAKSTGAQGVFSDVTSVQRLSTTGGVAPQNCFAAESGQRLRVAYTADYYFYKRKPAATASSSAGASFGY